MADKERQQIQVHPQAQRYEGGLKSQQSGPSSTQVLAVLAGVPVGGTLLGLAGLTLVGSVIGLMVATPLLIIFSPVIVPAALTIAVAVMAILASGVFGLTGLSSISWVLNYIRRTRGTLPEQMDQAKRRMADVVGYTGQKGKDLGQQMQNRAQEAQRT